MSKTRIIETHYLDTKMKLSKAQELAEHVKALLSPHCHRIEIAGSIRRQKPDVKDIEIVAIAKPWQTGLFVDGIAEVCSQWVKEIGDIENYRDCKQTRRLLPEGIKLDLFLANADNWGWIFALRTGSSEFNQHVLLPALKRRGYVADKGHIWWNGKIQPVKEEQRLFEIASLPFYQPHERNFSHLPLKSY